MLGSHREGKLMRRVNMNIPGIIFYGIIVSIYWVIYYIRWDNLEFGSVPFILFGWFINILYIIYAIYWIYAHHIISLNIHIT